MRPWEETWSAWYDHMPSSWYVSSGNGERPDGWRMMAPSKVPYGDQGYAHLIAAAPQMARALCLVEWAATSEYSGPLCPCCLGYEPSQWGEHEERMDAFTTGLVVKGHHPDCKLDAALTAAGLGPEERKEVRRKAAGK